MREDEKKIFLGPLPKKKESEIRKLVRELCGRLSTMRQIIPVVILDNSDAHLDYFSSIYTEISPIIAAITIYAVKNRYPGRNSKIDNYIIQSLKIFGLLKVLHERNERKKNGYKRLEDDYNRLSNHAILLEIMDHYKSM